MSTQFGFLQVQWPDVAASAQRAEALARSDARAACMYARRAIELAVTWLYRNDPALRLPYQDSLSALIHEPSFRDLVGPVVLTKLKLLKDLGNLAVHSGKPVTERDAVAAVRELFHVGYWLARTYGRASRPEPGLYFDAQRLPPSQSLAQMQAEELRRRAEEILAERDAQLAALMKGRASLDAELQQLRAEVAALREANTALPDQHDFNEAETRTAYIDLLLREAGWLLQQPRDREFPVTGMPTESGQGFVDYVLWGDDGLPLAVVEAKRSTLDSRNGQQQAKLYADCLEQRYGRRPLIYTSNGYEHWFWNDAVDPPRAVQGFHKRAELEALLHRREQRRALMDESIDANIAGRPYQQRAIRRIAESFERDRHRRALLVMATGAGKTRTVIALCDLLIRAGWVKRVLFLCDRIALAKQAAREFNKHLPHVATVNLQQNKTGDGRVFVCTYPTMMGLIEESDGAERRFGIGHFDLVVIDEAHRSVYRKYGAIFDYFDAHLVGLTATPRGEIDRNTYRLFHLEPGVPTDVYDIADAVRDGWLVPPQAISVPLQFPRSGIRYADLSDEEKEQWDAVEWPDDADAADAESGRREQVDAEAVNAWLFNADTVDRALQYLMTHGLRVDDGERLAKTIIFARNQPHALFIEERFNLHYPHLRGQFARVITFQTRHAQSLIDDFSKPHDPPHIAISVDMLDTGIDVPEVANLLFFKPVRSSTKFWQMVGRGTRLCENLFGPGEHKTSFKIFDFCGNLEFFSVNAAATDTAAGMSLSERLFAARLELIAALDEALGNRVGESTDDGELRARLADALHAAVAGMHQDNFVVRPHLRLVDAYRERAAWDCFDRDDDLRVLGRLPTSVEDRDVAAKQFDGLMLKLQLSVVVGRRGIPLLEQAESLPDKQKKALFESVGLWAWFCGFSRLRRKVRDATAPLLEKRNIPAVEHVVPLLDDIQSALWWFGVNASALEDARIKLRSLIALIDAPERKAVYADFMDVQGDAAEIELPQFTAAVNYENFKQRARMFLREHENHLAIRRLRHNEPLTPMDLGELERILLESGIGSAKDLEMAKIEANGLGRFVRGLVGLDRAAVQTALAKFVSGQNLSSDQHEFINMVVDHLTQHGEMQASALYQAPYTDLHPLGVIGLFTPAQSEALRVTLNEIDSRAA